MQSKKTKILYVITKSNFGGAQRYVFELATRFSKEMFDVTVAFGGNGILKEKLEEAGIKTYTIKNFERDINMFKEVGAMWELFLLMRSYRPDIVHVNSSKAGGSGALVARLIGVPHILFTAHGWPFFEKRNVLWRFLAWKFSYLTTLLAHTVIVVSKHDLKNACMPLLRKKIIYIPTGVNPISFIERDSARIELCGPEKTSFHESDLWAVSTGEHTQNKNLHTLIQSVYAYNQIQPQKIFLTLMSDGEEKTSLETLVRKYGMDEYVHFTGFIPSAQSYLVAFDIFLIPSYKEGLPYGLLEAGLAGLACIGSNVGGVPEILISGETGILVNPRDTSSITDALIELARNPNKRMLLGEKLKKKVTEEYSFQKLFEKTKVLYESRHLSP